MSESFDISWSLLFAKHSLIQYFSSEKQNLLFFRILTGISPADALTEGKFFKFYLAVALETCLKDNILLSWNFSLIISIQGWYEELSMILWTLSSLTFSFEDQVNADLSHLIWVLKRCKY